jgi:hypothetical protein
MDYRISGTHLPYCHWCWIFPLYGLPLGWGGLPGFLQDETTPDPWLLSYSQIDSTQLGMEKSFLLSNLHPCCCLCTTDFLRASYVT